LASFTQLPFVASVSAAFGSAFGVVGGALTATFGAAIGYLGSLVGVAIPQVVLAFSLIMSVVVMPALTLVTWGVEALSNLIMQWVEQRPFYTLFAKLKFWGPKEEGAGKVQNDQKEKVPYPLYVHQAEPGGDGVVSEKPLRLVVNKGQGLSTVFEQVKILEVIDPEQSERIWIQARADECHSNQRNRRAKPEELNATQEQQAREFEGIMKLVSVEMRCW
jgi:hypothetical protein